MRISKKIMNPKRINQLKILAELDDETNAMFLSNKSQTYLPHVELSVKRFGELGLIVYTGDEFFAISDKGRGYLNELAEKEAEQSEDNQFKPNYAVPPAETMMEVLEDRGMTLNDFAEKTGMQLSQLEEVKKATAPIEQPLAEALEKETGINHRFWLKLESNYQHTLTRLGKNIR